MGNPFPFFDGGGIPGPDGSIADAATPVDGLPLPLCSLGVETVTTPLPNPRHQNGRVHAIMTPPAATEELVQPLKVTKLGQYTKWGVIWTWADAPNDGSEMQFNSNEQFLNDPMARSGHTVSYYVQGAVSGSDTCVQVGSGVTFIYCQSRIDLQPNKDYVFHIKKIGLEGTNAKWLGFIEDVASACATPVGTIVTQHQKIGYWRVVEEYLGPAVACNALPKTTLQAKTTASFTSLDKGDCGDSSASVDDDTVTLSLGAL